MSTGQGVLGNNMFAYCDNNPTVRIDTDGEFWHIVIGGIVGGLVNGVVKAVSNVVEGKDITDGLGTAILSGTASGALGATGVGMIGSVTGNAIIAAAESTTNQIIDNGGFNNFNAGDVITDGIIGGVSGAIGGAGKGSKHLNNLGKQTVKRTVNTTANKGLMAGIKASGKAFSYYGKNTKSFYGPFVKGLKKDFIVSLGSAAATSDFMKHQYKHSFGR